MTTSWTQDGWAYSPGSVDELWSVISRVGTFSAGRRYVWRGVRDVRWPLRSSLQRFALERNPKFALNSEPDLRQMEVSLLKAARDWNIEGTEGFHDQALLALLQHYDAPTRLLDVTSDPMTALWFAAQTDPASARQSSGAVFAVDVTDFPTLRTNDGNVGDSWDAFGPGAKSSRYKHELNESAQLHRPFIVQPMTRDPRMTAQQGLFLAGAAPSGEGVRNVDAFDLKAEPTDQNTLRQLLKGERVRGRPQRLNFVVLVVPSQIKQKVRLHLETTYARSGRVLFPDFPGFADAVRQGSVLVAEAPA